MVKITNSDELEAWLKHRPREDAVLIAARAALRVFPLLIPEHKNQGGESRDARMLPSIRAMAAAHLAGTCSKRNNEVSFAAKDTGRTTMATAVSPASDAIAAAAQLATAPPFLHASSTAKSAANAAGDDAPQVWAAVSKDVRVLNGGSDHADFIPLPLWPSGVPTGTTDAWDTLRDHLLAANEGWEVWTDWYQDRLDGKPANQELELAKALIPDEIWQADPATLNAEIARLIAEHHADQPAGENLDLDPETETICSTPAPIEREDAVETAVSLVEDSLSDLRASAVGNRCYALNHVFVRLDRMLTKYRENPLRLHEDMKFAAEEIVTEIGKDDDLDEGPVRALRDACGQGVIDIRISVPDVAEMHGERQKRIARKPSANSRRAVDRLMDEIGDGIQPDLREQMQEDLRSVDRSGTADGEEMPDSSARDAFLTSVRRFAWLYRFSRLGEGRIAAVAERLGTTIDKVEKVVDLFRGAEGWWAVIEMLMKAV